MKVLIALTSVALLTGCAAISSVKEKVVGTVAEKGNDYCEAVQVDPDLRSEVLTRVNEALREEGAKWTILGVECDAPE